MKTSLLETLTSEEAPFQKLFSNFLKNRGRLFEMSTLVKSTVKAEDTNTPALPTQDRTSLPPESMPRPSPEIWSRDEDDIAALLPEMEKSKGPLTTWQKIMEESESGRRLHKQIKEYQDPPDPEVTNTDTPMDFLDREIFPVLLPALEYILLRAHAWDCLMVQKSAFNGIDVLAEYLWNTNPQHPKRAENWTALFDIPPFAKWLMEHPRPKYPLSWLWSQDEAALRIQSYFRGYLVRRTHEVQEMRQFWKILQKEKEDSQMAELEAAQSPLESLLQRIGEQTGQFVSTMIDKALKDMEITHKGAKGFVGRAVGKAVEKVAKEEEEMKRSIDPEFTEPYMTIHPFQSNWDNETS